MKTIKLIEPKLNKQTEELQLFQDLKSTQEQEDSSKFLKNSLNHFKWDDLKISSNDRTIPKPITFSWKHTSDSTSLIYELHLATNKNLTNKQIFKTDSKTSYSVINLLVGTEYFWQVIALKDEAIIAKSHIWSFLTHPKPPRWIYVPGMTNVRDIGGWTLPNGNKIKQSIIFRSSEMNSHLNITKEGHRVLLDELKIKTDIDLRGETEECQAVLDTNKVKWINLPILPYQGIIDKNSKENYSKIFKIFANSKNYPILFHCWGGCDRAGTVAFLLNALLGLSIENLIKDYELSTFTIWGERSHLSDWFQALLITLQQITPNKNINIQVEEYLKSIGITEKEIISIRNNLIHIQ
jgi:protein tyrosine/serine phosphatase